MKLIGLTGGVGMGKSTAADFLRQRNLPVIDTDVVARQIVEPGQPALVEIKRAFGESVIDHQGRLDRAKLAQIVFAESGARQRLEDILHPRIRGVWTAQAELWRNAGMPLAVVVIPLLFETGAETHFDDVICVACSAETQVERLLKRGWSFRELEQRIKAQWSIEEKLIRANYVIWTDCPVQVHRNQLEQIKCLWQQV